MDPGSKKMEPAKSSSQADIANAVSDTHEEQALDEALWETFPASDPIAVSSARSGNRQRPSHQDEKDRSAAHRGT